MFLPLNDVLLANINDSDYNDIAGPVNSSEKDLAQNSGWYKYTTYRNMGIDAYGDANRALREFTQAYLACVAFVDEQVGKVLDAIENSDDPNIVNNTIIILTSDHGYHLGEKEFIFKHTPWEESVRVPFLVSGPGVASNQICNQPISLVDIYPTCIDLAEMTAPHTLDGHSIKPLLENPVNANWTGNVYSVSGIASKYGYNVDSDGNYTSTFQSQYNNTKLPYSSAHFSIRTEQFRYIYYRDGEEELYDHISDPNEINNLAHSSVRQDYEDVLTQMNLYYQYSVGLATPPPPGPTFYFVKPTAGEGFYLNQPIELEADGTNIDLSSVEFYIEGSTIKKDSVAPYTATIFEVGEGDITLSAIGIQNNGEDLSDSVTISVSSSVNPDDSDNDGLSDAWELNYLSSLVYGAADDPDGDSYNNIYEYRSGTDPNNLGSFFKVLNSNFTHGGTQDTLQWLGNAEKQYRVLSKTDLTSSQWEIEEEAIDGSISTFNIWNGNHLDAPSKFYKVEIDQ